MWMTGLVATRSIASIRNPLASAKACGPSSVRKLSRFTITCRLARRHDESVVERGKGSIARPRVEIALHRGIGWKILRQLPPLATGGRNVEDRVHHRSHVGFARTPEGRSRRQKRLHHKTLGIHRIAFISQAL